MSLRVPIYQVMAWSVHALTHTHMLQTHIHTRAHVTGKFVNKLNRWYVCTTTRPLSPLVMEFNTDSTMITVSGPLRTTTLTLQIRRECTRSWLNLCSTGPFKATTHACLHMDKQDLGSLTGELYVKYMRMMHALGANVDMICTKYRVVVVTVSWVKEMLVE